MSDANSPQRIFHHVAVSLGEFILVFGGSCGNYEKYTPVSHHIIWMYNQYTEQWRKYIIPESKLCPPNSAGSCAVTIKEDVFFFGGYNSSQSTYSNELWKLRKSTEGSFTWSEVTTEKMNVPSPRYRHSGWTFSGKLWIFGGSGTSLDGYLNDNGSFLQHHNYISRGCNNQLLSFNPSSEEWVNLECSGSIPSPRGFHASTIIGDKVWLYGGYNDTLVFDELYELSMPSLIWAHVQTDKTKPQERFSCSLNAITHDKLLLYGGGTVYKTLSDSWILDLPSKTWKQYKPGDYHRRAHTGSTGINSNSLIIGGRIFPVDHSCDDHPTTFCIRLEPRSLQQLAMQTIYKHRNLVSCECLPKKLITLLGMSSNEENTGEI